MPDPIRSITQSDAGPLGRRVGVFVAAFAVLLAAGPGHAANDAGASTFESAERLYRRKAFRAEDVVVPPVVVKAAEPKEAEKPAETGGTRFAIDSFEVGGNTLLPAARIESAIGAFRGKDKTIEDVQKARDALQKVYDEEGLLSVAVTIPPQTVEGGLVRLEVVEARVGKVEVENEGIDWFSEEGVRKDVPHIQPNAILRREELQADLIEANRNPDRRVRPTLKAGTEPGTVDVGLQVQDRIPLHGSVTASNNYSPGSPEERIATQLSYGNLWGLEHEIGASYQFSPTDRFQDLQIVSGTYRAPMPWDRDQSLFYYVVYSDSKNGIVNAADLTALGRGFNMGLRYRIDLGTVDWLGGFSHAFTLAIDRKDVKNSVQAPGAEITTPITYLPFGFEYSASRAGDQTFAAGQIGLTLNKAGTLSGGTRDDFRANRGGLEAVTGDFAILNLGLQTGLRLSALIETLAAQTWTVPEKSDRPLTEDWAFFVRTRGQVSSEPLISTEQFAAGGLDSVRGYLQSEQFGDDGWSGQFEFRSRPLRHFLGGRLGESAQAIVFYDAAVLHVKNEETESGDTNNQNGLSTWQSLQSYGFGVRARFFDRVTADFWFARPVDTTSTTNGNTSRFQFQIGTGF